MKATQALSLTTLIVLSAAANAASIIVDETDLGFTDHGPGAMAVDNGGVHFDGSALSSLVVLMNAPDAYVSWTFTGLDSAKTYDVAATWSNIDSWPQNNLNTGAHYTIIGDSTVMEELNHSVPANADYVEQDSSMVSHNFETIGQVKPKNDGTIVLELRDTDANGILGVVADAALVNAVPEPSSGLLAGLGAVTMLLLRRK